MGWSDGYPARADLQSMPLSKWYLPSLLGPKLQNKAKGKIELICPSHSRILLFYKSNFWGSIVWARIANP